MRRPTTRSARRAQALQIAAGLARRRLLLIARRESTAVSGVFLVILSFWLVVLFARGPDPAQRVRPSGAVEGMSRTRP